MKNLIITLTVLSIPLSAIANDPTALAMSMAKESKIVDQYTKVEMVSAKNTRFDLVFNKDGTFREAEGNHLSDENIVVNADTISLRSAAGVIKKAGLSLGEEWDLKKIENKFTYVFYVGDRKYFVDALTGQRVTPNFTPENK